MHLLVASGGNVGFVTLIVYFLCSLLGLKRLARALLALSFALLYTFAAGADAPLTRAYIMTLAATIGFILGRKSGIMHPRRKGMFNRPSDDPRQTGRPFNHFILLPAAAGLFPSTCAQQNVLYSA